MRSEQSRLAVVRRVAIAAWYSGTLDRRRRRYCFQPGIHGLRDAWQDRPARQRGRHEPGVDVTLFGTGSAAHATANIASILSPPLPQADRERLAREFGHLEGVGLTLPEKVAR